jgi:hypothetical protein
MVRIPAGKRVRARYSTEARRARRRSVGFDPRAAGYTSGTVIVSIDSRRIFMASAA